MKENHDFLRRSLEEDYRARSGGAEFDAEMMSWWIFASDLLFTSLTNMNKGDEIPKEKVLESVKNIEKILFPEG